MKNSAKQISHLTGKQYYEGFKEFLDRSDQKQYSLEWFKKQFNMRTDIQHVLSIGCGEGEFDIAWLKTLTNVHRYVGIEPNPSHVSAFRQRIETENLPRRLFIRLIQECIENIDLFPGFDLICISQSLYYPENKPGVIEKAFELLNSNGDLVIFHTIGNCGIDHLKQKFESHTYRYTDKNLLSDLDHIQIPYKKEVLSSKILIKDLPISLLAFMLERPVSEEEYLEAKAYLHQHCPDGYLDHPLLVVRISSGFSDDAYCEDYCNFRELTDTIPVIRQWMKNFLSTLDTPVNNILSIGCGNGQIDNSCFLEPLDSLCTYTGLDPNEKHLQIFHQKISLYSKAKVKLLSQYFEDFHTDQRYDLILMSHVLYYIPQRKFALSKACTLLSDKGVLVIFHQTERGINVLQKRYGRTRYSYNSVELARELDTLAIPYRYEELDSYVNLDEISDSLIRFFLEGMITKWQATNVRQYLLRQYPEKRMHHPIGIFIISAQNFHKAIQPRLLSDAEYAEYFSEFLFRSNQHDKILRWVHTQSLINLNSVQSMLSVGCGSGIFDLKFAQLLPNLNKLTLVEPNNDHLSSLEKNVAEVSVPFTTHIKDSYLEACQFNEPFDLILFAHSLYYMQDVESILKQASNMLSKHGKLLLLHEPPSGGMVQMLKQMGLFGRISLTSHHLEQYLAKLELDYQIDVIPINLDIQEISNGILNFLLERKPTKSELVEAHRHLLNMSDNGFLVQNTVAIIAQ